MWHDHGPRLVHDRILPGGPWEYTDDTMMAMSIVDQLDARGRIDQDELARRFAARFVEDPTRGYGAGAMGLLARIADGADWAEAAGAMFDGQGSWGNGSAMRVGPVGAYFAEDVEAVVEQARAFAAALREKGYEVMTARVEGKGHVSMLLTRGGRATVMHNMMKFLSTLRRPQR